MNARMLCFVCLFLPAIWSQGQRVASSTGMNAQKASIVENYGRLPLAFEANQGQTDATVKFLSRSVGYGVFLTFTEAVLALSGDFGPDLAALATKASVSHGTRASALLRPNTPISGAKKSMGLCMKLVGANDSAQVAKRKCVSGLVLMIAARR